MNLPDRDHPVVILALLFALLAPGLAMYQLGVQGSDYLLVHAVGVILLISGAYFVLGLADTGILGFVGVIALCSWGARWLLPVLSIPLAAILGGAATGLLVVFTRGLSKVVTLSASLVIAVLLLQAIPTATPQAVTDLFEMGWLAAAALLAVLYFSRSTAADALRLRLQNDERAAPVLLSVPVHDLQLLMAVVGGAVAAIGCAVLDHVGWSPLDQAETHARLVTVLGVAVVIMVGGQQRLGHLLIVALPLMLLPAAARLLHPGMPDATLAISMLGVALAVWLGKSRWVAR